MTDDFSDATSFTTSFGYGPMAEIMASKFFIATVNYHEYVLSAYDETLDLETADLDFSEWSDDWVKILHDMSVPDEFIMDTMDSEGSYYEELDKLLSFITKWSHVK